MKITPTHSDSPVAAETAAAEVTASDLSIHLDRIANIGQAVSLAAAAVPEQIAVAEPDRTRRGHFRTINFRELDRRSDQLTQGLRLVGVPSGSRICLMIPPSIDFVSGVFGLFKAGMQIVLIDPGMGRRNLLQCLVEADPQGLVGIPIAHWLRRLVHSKLPNCRFNFVAGSRWGTGAIPLADFDRLAGTVSPESGENRHHPAAMIFTSGSTGIPKGVLYRHRHFIEQVEQIRDYFGIQPGGVDVSGFPLFALFNVAMGTTTVFPEMDATRPARVDPRRFLAAVERFQANQSFGSPALWNTVARYCERTGLRMRSIRRVLTAGAPVPSHVLQRVRQSIHADGEVHTPYGATEALPVACIESRRVLEETAIQTAQGRGICVGTRFPRLDWKVIAIGDQPLTTWEDGLEVNTGQIGELVVRGPVVTDRYLTRLEANALHKIQDGETFWHRMGDVGYLDEQQRFWFCGRKSQRVETANSTLFTIPCEAIFNSHPQIYRSALVGIGLPGSQLPAIVVEPWPESRPTGLRGKKKLIQELAQLACSHAHTREIKNFLIKNALPVDTRHNSKIFRERLAIWAARRIPHPS